MSAFDRRRELPHGRKRDLGPGGVRFSAFTIVCLPVALWRGRVIGTDCRRLLVLHVSSDDQKHEQGGGDDYPIVELHQFWHVRSICHYVESSSEPRHPAGGFLLLASAEPVGHDSAKYMPPMRHGSALIHFILPARNRHCCVAALAGHVWWCTREI